MRYQLVCGVVAVFLMAPLAAAVTITNLDQESVRVFVCDDDCGPSHGDDWGSARDFWLAAGEAKSFDCNGKCYVGIYYDDHSPTLGDMAMADEDELFSSAESGYIKKGVAAHKAN